MKNMRRTFLYTILLISPGWMWAWQTEAGASSFLDPQGAQKSNAREEEVYSSAQDALNDGEYGRAAQAYGVVAAMRGRRADAGGLDDIVLHLRRHRTDQGDALDGEQFADRRDADLAHVSLIGAIGQR